MATPEFAVFRAEYLWIAGFHRLEVFGHARLRILRRHNRIDECVLVVFGILGLLGHLEQQTGESQHVVLVAGLHRGVVLVTTTIGRIAIGRGVLPSLVRHMEMLRLAVASVHIGVVVDDDIPEIPRGFQIQACELALLVG